MQKCLKYVLLLFGLIHKQLSASFFSVRYCSLLICLSRDKFRFLYDVQFVRKKCGVQKNRWLVDSYVKEEAGVVCALLV